MTASAGGDEPRGLNPSAETPGAIAEHGLFVVAMLLVVFLAAVSGFEWWLEHRLANAGIDRNTILLEHTIRLTEAKPRQEWSIDWSDWNPKRGTAWTRTHLRRAASETGPTVEPCALRVRVSTDRAHAALLGELAHAEPDPGDWRELTLAEPDQWMMLGNGRTHPDRCCPTILGLESANGCRGAFDVSIELSDGDHDGDLGEGASVTSLLVNLAGFAKLGLLAALGVVLVLLRIVGRRRWRE